MDGRLPAALLAGLLAAPAAAAPVLRVGVGAFEAARGVDADGAAVGDLFGAALYRSFPGVAVVGRGEAGSAAGLDAVLTGTVLAADLDEGGRGGTLMMSARLLKRTGELLWADTRTVSLSPSLLSRGRGGAPALKARLLELAVYRLVQDLGKRLPAGALAPAGEEEARPARERGCVAPAFYDTLARDQDWYYGAGRHPDPDKARELALARLASQAAGADAPAGLLAGWEQDDFKRCDGVSYVLVRVEKERVRAQAEAYRRRLAAVAPPPSAPARDRRVERLARANDAGVDLLFSGLAAAGKQRSPLGEEEKAAVARAREALGAGRLALPELLRAWAALAARGREREKLRLLQEVLDEERRPPPGAAEEDALLREMSYPLAWNSAAALKDWGLLFRYSGEYLRRHPDGLHATAAQRHRANAAKILMEGDRLAAGVSDAPVEG